MESALFALAGVLLGALIVKEPAKRNTLKKRVSAEKTEVSDSAASEKQLMQQWQNLLSYGGQMDKQ